jgi:GAF domain-containing protein
MKESAMSEGIDTQEFRYRGDERAASLEELVLQLQDLILQSSDVRDFLTDMATIIASRLSRSGNHISCGITVIRNKRPTTVASSDSGAWILDELQNGFGDGPCLTALRSETMIYVPDLESEFRWPKYNAAARAADVRSILAVPMHLQAPAQAVANFYAPTTDGFSHHGIDTAESLTGTAAKALDIALSITQLRSARDDLSAALKSRTVIDTAIGVIIAQNRCGRDEAFDILVKTSSHRNVKLREVAASIVSSVAGEREFPTPYNE